MLKIQKKVEYALITIKYMLDQPAMGLFRAKDIALAFGIPFDATSRVLQILAANHYVQSSQGAKGGYQILEQINNLNLLQLIEMIEGPQSVVKCLGAEEACSMIVDCNMASPMHQLNQKLLEFCRSIMVVELVNSHQAIAPSFKVKENSVVL